MCVCVCTHGDAVNIPDTFKQSCRHGTCNWDISRHRGADSLCRGTLIDCALIDQGSRSSRVISRSYYVYLIFSKAILGDSRIDVRIIIFVFFFFKYFTNRRSNRQPIRVSARPIGRETWCTRLAAHVYDFSVRVKPSSFATMSSLTMVIHNPWIYMNSSAYGRNICHGNTVDSHRSANPPACTRSDRDRLTVISLRSYRSTGSVCLILFPRLSFTRIGLLPPPPRIVPDSIRSSRI